MRPRTLAVVVVTCGLLGCEVPRYGAGTLQCSIDQRCPDDFYCAADDRCWPVGSAEADLGRSSCPGTFKLCDDFESASLDRRWEMPAGNGSVTIDRARAYRGSASLHLHSDAAAAVPSAVVQTYAMLPLAGTLHVRAWVYVPASYPDAFDQIINLVDNSGGGVSYATNNGHPANNAYTAAVYRESTTVLPKGRWTCLTLVVGQSGATGPISLFLDDSELGDVRLAGVATPAVTHMILGLDWKDVASGFGPTDLWIDEVALDDRPIACAD